MTRWLVQIALFGGVRICNICLHGIENLTWVVLELYLSTHSLQSKFNFEILIKIYILPLTWQTPPIIYRIGWQASGCLSQFVTIEIVSTWSTVTWEVLYERHSTWKDRWCCMGQRVALCGFSEACTGLWSATLSCIIVNIMVSHWLEQVLFGAFVVKITIWG